MMFVMEAARLGMLRRRIILLSVWCVMRMVWFFVHFALRRAFILQFFSNFYGEIGGSWKRIDLVLVCNDLITEFSKLG